MAIYAIGDIQGCDKSFKALLKKIHFKPNTDEVLLVGDLINRGPRSADVLQRILDQNGAISSVLGNHDITLLAVQAGFVKPKKKDTFNHILESKNALYLIDYLRYLPMLLYRETEFKKIVITHAGLHPKWSISEAQQYSLEVQNILQDPTLNYINFLEVLFNNHPNFWDDSLKGYDRLRALINCFTRMRCLDKNENLDFQYKESLAGIPANLAPWFYFERPKHDDFHLIYGHWAGIGLNEFSNTLCIDTGCVWRDRLTAVRIDTPDYEFFSVPNHD